MVFINSNFDLPPTAVGALLVIVVVVVLVVRRRRRTPAGEDVMHKVCHAHACPHCDMCMCLLQRESLNHTQLARMRTSWHVRVWVQYTKGWIVAPLLLDASS